MVHAVLWADVTCGGGEAVVARQHVTDQRVVQVDHWQQRIERPLGQCALRAGPGG